MLDGGGAAPRRYVGGQPPPRMSTSPKLKFDAAGIGSPMSTGRGVSIGAASHHTDVAAAYAEEPTGLAPMTDQAARDLGLGGRTRGFSMSSAFGTQLGATRSLSLQPEMRLTNMVSGGSVSRAGAAPEFGAAFGLVDTFNSRGISHSQPQEYDGGEEEDEYAEEEYEEEDLPLPPFPNDALPVVPAERLQGHTRRLNWEQHPANMIVLSLLQRRGVIPQLHRSITEYHMAESFLNCLSALQRGSYFVRYAVKNASPKERYFNLQLLPDSNQRISPFLCWYIHRTAVQMIDKVPLDDLVGISANTKSPAFRRWMLSHDIIKGCMQGHHRGRMSTRGCFTLWFYDRVGQRPRSVDLLTNNMSIYHLWIRTLEGILSVNSTSLNGQTDATQEMQHLMRLAQRHMRRGDLDEEEDALAAAQFVDN